MTTALEQQCRITTQRLVAAMQEIEMLARIEINQPGSAEHRFASLTRIRDTANAALVSEGIEVRHG